MKRGRLRDRLIEAGLWFADDERDPETEIGAAWELLERVLDTFEEFEKYRLTFGMEYSQRIDWTASVVPGSNHPKAREYEAFWQQGGSAAEAITRAVLFTVSELRSEATA